MSFQRKYCEAVKAAIEENESIMSAGNVTVSIEDDVSAEEEAQRALGKMGLLVLIATTGHTRTPGSGASTSGDLGLEITVFENPRLNRAGNRSAFTLTQAAEKIADTLHWRLFDGFQHRLRYLSMQRADADSKDARMVVTFAASQAFDPNKAVKWGIGVKTIWGEVQTKNRVRGGEAIFEPGRNGRGRFMGVVDPHWKITLTATVEIAAPELPELGQSFEYDGVTYYTTEAQSSESGEDGATVTLSGRTMDQ